jgi:hypothetical protein
VPGQVLNLTCPTSPGASGVLSINWEQPESAAHSINDYAVEVQEYFQLPGDQNLGLRPLTPPLEFEVQPHGELVASITSGVGE